VEVDVFQVAPRHSRGLVILAVAAAVALSACGSSTPSPSPTPTPSGTDTSQPSTSEQPSGSTTALDGASTALTNLSSYKFTMTVIGGDVADNTLSSLPNAPTSGIFKVSGTYLFTPTQAADVTVAGSFHEISVGGTDYQDNGMTGSFTEDDTGATVLVDDLSPTTVYGEFDFSGNFNTVGDETKDGVDSTHFQAADSSALAEFATVSGVEAGVWTADVWVANQGGYPVAISIVGTTSATDKTVVYERTFDLTNVNSATNTVTAPTNISGA
jgi:hypothetical protein